MKNENTISLKILLIYSIILITCALLAGCIFSKSYYKEDQEDEMTEWELVSITPGSSYTEQRWKDGNDVYHLIKSTFCIENYKVGEKHCWPTRR